MSGTATNSALGGVAAASSAEVSTSVGSQSLRPPVIPDHELLQRIGGGAYGEVWLARNVLGELRAVKVIHRSRFTDARPFEREFEGIQRFEPISRSHPSQLAILHVGKNDAADCFYYVMELADDANSVGQASSLSGAQRDLPKETGKMPVLRFTPRTLRHDLDEHARLPIPDCIQISLSLTTALAHLHQHGLVHRDIKPSNVIFVNGVPKLGDIGLVTEAGDTQSIVGTEGYIPPEGPGTPQADIFSLGKVLYEISTGLDRRRFAELPEDLRSWPDRSAVVEFNEILLKACAKVPERRYQSAEEMRAEIDLLHCGQSVKRQRAWQRTWSYAKRFAQAIGALAFVSAIVYSLALRAPHSSSFKSSPVPEANDEYTRGIDELHLNLNAAEAIRHLEKATELDPKFADAYAQLAEAWYSIPGETNSRNGQEAAETAVKLDSESGLACAALAAARVFALDFAAAERETKRAVELSPDSEQVLLISALSFAAIGRTNEALASLKKATDVGRHTPSRLRIIYSGFVYGWCREYDRAIALYDATPWLKDAVVTPHFLQAQCYLAKGDYTNAMRLGRQSALERGIDSKQINAEFDALETAFKQGGPERYWRQRLDNESSNTGHHDWMNFAAIHARLSQPDKALEYLRLAREKTPAALSIRIYTDASFDSLREDPQFQRLIGELWRTK